MPAWFRRGGGQDHSDDEPTGQIAAISLARIIEEADAENAAQSASESGGTGRSGIDSRPGRSDLEQALADRRSLIEMCLYAMDRARSGGVVERIEHGLAEVGVRAVRPDGDRFDPALHEAGSVLPTEDGALDGMVAETEVVGFVDRERLLRAPVVTVFTKRAP